MQTFTDTAGRTWELGLTVGSYQRVKALTGADLLDLEGNVILTLADDPVLLCNVLYALVKPQADAAGVTDEQFGEALGGDALDAASEGILKEIVAFFRPRQRLPLQRVLAKAEEIWQTIDRHVEAKLASGEIEAKIASQLGPEPKSTPSVSASQELSASTPAPGPSAS